MNRRVGCLILALLFALLFIFWGMMCRLTLPLSPEAPATRSVPASQAGSMEGVYKVLAGAPFILSLPKDDLGFNQPLPSQPSVLRQAQDERLGFVNTPRTPRRA